MDTIFNDNDSLKNKFWGMENDLKKLKQRMDALGEDAGERPAEGAQPAAAARDIEELRRELAEIKTHVGTIFERIGSMPGKEDLKRVDESVKTTKEDIDKNVTKIKNDLERHVGESKQTAKDITDLKADTATKATKEELKKLSDRSGKTEAQIQELRKKVEGDAKRLSDDIAQVKKDVSANGQECKKMRGEQDEHFRETDQSIRELQAKVQMDAARVGACKCKGA